MKQVFLWILVIAVCLCAFVTAVNVEKIGADISDLQTEVESLTERVDDLDERVSALESAYGSYGG